MSTTVSKIYIHCRSFADKVLNEIQRLRIKDNILASKMDILFSTISKIENSRIVFLPSKSVDFQLLTELKNLINPQQLKPGANNY